MPRLARAVDVRSMLAPVALCAPGCERRNLGSLSSVAAHARNRREGPFVEMASPGCNLKTTADSSATGGRAAPPATWRPMPSMNAGPTRQRNGPRGNKPSMNRDHRAALAGSACLDGLPADGPVRACPGFGSPVPARRHSAGHDGGAVLVGEGQETHQRSGGSEKSRLRGLPGPWRHPQVSGSTEGARHAGPRGDAPLAGPRKTQPEGSDSTAIATGCVC